MDHQVPIALGVWKLNTKVRSLRINPCAQGGESGGPEHTSHPLEWCATGLQGLLLCLASPVLKPKCLEELHKAVYL